MPTGARIPLLMLGLLLVASLPLPEATEAKPPQAQGCRRHNPIAIDGDDRIVLAQTRNGPRYDPRSGVVSGSGTPGDPFVVEGWCIEGSPGRPAISVAGASRPILVRGNTLTGNVTGVLVANSTGVTVEGNDLNGTDGIEVRGSPAVVAANWLDGGRIAVFSSSGYDVRSNILQHGRGIWVEGSRSGTVEGNLLSHSLGINLMESDGNDVRHNVAAWGSVGVAAYFSEGNRVERNAASNVIVGLIMQEGQGNTFAGNAIDNASTGSILSGGRSLLFAGNTFSWIEFEAMLVVGGAGPLVEGNTFVRTNMEPSRCSLYMVFADNATVARNNFTGGQTCGLMADFSPGLAVTRNRFTRNVDGAVWLRGPGAARLQGNSFEGNGLGVLAVNATADARLNWWGCPEGPSHEACDGVRGDVQFTPWLTSPP